MDYFEEILLDNRVNKDEFNKNPENVKSLECFHYNLPEIPNFFSNFTGLTDLRILEQDIINLDWLKDCPNLINLNVFHTNLKCTKGLVYVCNLKKLFLDGNKLERFPDISNLKSITEFSIADNNIGDIPDIPVLPSLQVLNLAKCNLSSLPKTVVNLSSLSTLNIAGNNFDDFSLFYTLSPLQYLQELYLYHPLYGENPVCSFPNYDVIPISVLPQITILDTYKINEKTKNLCVNRRKHAEIFYSAEASSNISVCYSQLNDFNKQYRQMLSDIDANIKVNKDILLNVYASVDEFESICRSEVEFYRQISTLSYQSGGSISFVEITDEDEINTITRNITLPSWMEVRFVMKLTVVSVQCEKDNTGNDNISEYFYAKINDLNEVPKNVQEWKQFQNTINYSSNIILENSSESVLVCTKSPISSTLFIPKFFCFFSKSANKFLADISRSLDEMRNGDNSVPIDHTNDSIYAFSSPYMLEENLVNVTLINCGVESLYMFKDLRSLKALYLPFNKITTLEDMPEIATLELLDVSFNKISSIQALLTQSQTASESIRSILIFGNPICSPKVINLMMQFFVNSEQLLDDPRVPLYVPPETDDSFFLTSVFPSDIQLESITSLDFRGQCLVSLSPLSQLPNLKILYSSDNLLRSIDFQSPTLQFGDFSANLIEEFPSGDSFPSLQTLLLGSNKLTSLDSIHSLQSLFISDNGISKLPDDEMFPNLLCISLQNNPLTKQYNDLRIIYSLPKLRMLNGQLVTAQMASRAKSTFGGILLVEHLYSVCPKNSISCNLSNKGYKEVNNLKCSTLTELDLSQNQIQVIEWSHSSLPSLQVLNLSSNIIAQFDFCSVLPQLAAIDLSSNKINDKVFYSMMNATFPRLKKVVLANNNIKSIEFSLKKVFPLLEEADFSHNFIQKVNPGVFELPTLKHLDLSYNVLRKLDNIVAPNLESLDLSHNRVPSVDEVEKLKGCTNLLKFAFNDNPLAQRISHRIRCLSILRTVKTMDGRLVTESDINQVRIILEQMQGGQSLLTPRAIQNQIGSRNNPKVTTSNPPLPPLQQAQAKRKIINFP